MKPLKKRLRNILLLLKNSNLHFPPTPTRYPPERVLAVKDITMEQVTRLDIARDGLNQAAPIASARTEAEQRNKEYQAHLERLKWDEDYRYKWEQNEREWMERQKKNYYY